MSPPEAHAAACLLVGLLDRLAVRRRSSGSSCHSSGVGAILFRVKALKSEPQEIVGDK